MQHHPLTLPDPRIAANRAPSPRPAWLYAADQATDVSDWWLECTDPENELGEVCTGYFEVNEYCERALMGCLIEHDHGFITILDRNRLLNRVTEAEIEALEARLMEFAA